MGSRPARNQGRPSDGSVAFLFLGELFLIPHLLPIAIALAQSPAPPRITLFVITSAHEEIVRDALARLGVDGVAIRRAWGYRRLAAGARETPRLPHKLVTLALNGPAILRHDVAVVAERTSLWLPRVARFGARFVYNEHGAGPHANFASPRNRFAARILMPGAGMADRVRDSVRAQLPVEAVGYIKRDYRRQMPAGSGMPVFDHERPTIIYVPHWLRCKSSWWSFGEQVLDHFARSRAYNLILAPHIRLPSVDPSFAHRIAPFRDCPNIHIDTGSFRLVDQSYIDGADMYLGDGSSQAVEFAEHPRPMLFLNPDAIDWRSDPRFSHWQMGDVIERIADIDAALARAPAALPAYRPIQEAYVALMMGHDDGHASDRAARVVLDVLAERRNQPAAAASPDSTLQPVPVRAEQ